MTTLISVVGAVEGDLIREFVRHYRGAGVRRFLIGVWFGPGSDPAREVATLDALAQEVDGGASLVRRGPWREETNGAVRDELRSRAGKGWHVFADVDEFHGYPGPLPDLLDEYRRNGQPTVEGLLLDRVAANGELAGWSLADGLDASFPLGGFVTANVLRGDPRKVMAARWDLSLSSGNHWVPGIRVGPAAAPPLPVHHFKWRAGCRRYLQLRRQAFDGSAVPAEISMRRECERALAHLDAHGGRFDVSPGNPAGFVKTTVSQTRRDWHDQMPAVMRYWWRDRWRWTAWR